VQAIPVALVITLSGLLITRSYAQTRGRSFVDEAYGLIGGLGLATVLELAGMALYRGFSYSRLLVLYVAVAGFALLVIWRGAMRQALAQLRRRGLGTTRALVVGSGAAADLLVHRLQMFPQYGYELVGAVDDRAASVGYRPLAVIGSTSDLSHLIYSHGVEVVFVALPETDHHQVLRLIAQCEKTGADFKIVPSLLEVITSGVVADDIEGIPLVGVRKSRLVGASLVVKRAFDLVTSLILLIPGLPLMGAIAVAIRLDSPGPMLYRQERVGREGRIFSLYKFRSMVKDAEKDTGPVFAERDDPRATRVGRLLRRYGLDEIPQVLNVLKGDMSLVGPRPERPHFVTQFEAGIPGYEQRHAVPPGMTGWAQVNDIRQDTPIEQRTSYDTFYIDNWSLAFDIKILLATFARVLFHRNAY